MLQGLRSSIHTVNDVEAGKNWYRQMLGIEPYFNSPQYVGFNVGGYELGLFSGFDQNAEIGVTPYWGVEDIHFALQQLLELGATMQNDITDVGGDILMATVIDPFGNVLGITRNPHFQTS